MNKVKVGGFDNGPKVTEDSITLVYNGQSKLIAQESNIDIIPLPAHEVLSEFVDKLKGLMTVDVTHPWGFGKLTVDMMEWASLLYKYELPIDKDWLESLSERERNQIESGELLIRREKKEKEE